jgi:hypothetical protein
VELLLKEIKSRIFITYFLFVFSKSFMFIVHSGLSVHSIYKFAFIFWLFPRMHVGGTVGCAYKINVISIISYKMSLN